MLKRGGGDCCFFRNEVFGSAGPFELFDVVELRCDLGGKGFEFFVEGA